MPALQAKNDVPVPVTRPAVITTRITVMNGPEFIVAPPATNARMALASNPAPTPAPRAPGAVRVPDTKLASKGVQAATCGARSATALPDTNVRMALALNPVPMRVLWEKRSVPEIQPIKLASKARKAVIFGDRL